ncbi:MAG: NADH-quinone oxidoreductase subunit L [Candidatus Rokubacteria bacterium]|nr:NADH-quinone oxidoreductase subunit L [Candidatus Rokubacteria bacterium]
MSRLVWLIPAFPLVGMLVNAVLGRVIGHRAHWISVPALFLSFLASTAVFARVWNGETYVGELFPWVVAGTFRTGVTVHVDQLSAVMLLVVTGVGFLIHVYSIGYMHEDEDYARFFTYLNLFVFSMLILVLAGNFLLLYLGWEAVGLSSYLLIGFWYRKPSAIIAGKKAFIVNRVGDFGFALGIMLIWVTFGTLDFGAVFGPAPPGVSAATYTAIGLLLFLGAAGKSAQLPLHVWLPDAMEGPTPVSALIHAATMVTAGVYMVARCHVLFERSPVALDVVAWVGGLTALFAATIGLAQTDIKKVLAYSTISQLGYMFAGVGVAAYAAGIFHLVTHAFFKALLFLGAGSVIHGMSGEQDMRRMGGLAPKMFITTITFIAGAAALSGIWPFAGFFSKDEIIASTFHAGHPVLGVVLLAGAFLTALYIFRVVFLTFFGGPRMSKEVVHHLHESPWVMTGPLIVLAVLSLVAGFAVGVPSAQGTPFARFLAPVLPLHPMDHGSSGAKLLLAVSLACGITGVALAWVLYARGRVRVDRIGVPRNGLHRLVFEKYYVDEIYDALVVRPLFAVCAWCARTVDLGVIDGVVNGIGRGVVAWGRGLRQLQTGFVMNYAFTMLLGAIAMVAYLLIR